MKATVWTSYGFKMCVDRQLPLQPKCIFRGEISYKPAAGDQIVVLDGYCCEEVDYVICGMDDSIEIHIKDCDAKNEYPEVPFEDSAVKPELTEKQIWAKARSLFQTFSESMNADGRFYCLDLCNAESSVQKGWIAVATRVLKGE